MVFTRTGELSPAEFQFYTKVLKALNASGIQFLVGGAYALAQYTGIVRHTKDLDLFVLPGDWNRIRDAMAELDYSVELTFPHWLGKAFCGDNFIDIIFSSGNAVARVDDEWFKRCSSDQVLGVDVKLCPAEEMIWQKSFIMERERFDGADVAHLINAQGLKLDWNHLLKRFDKDFRVLLSHLVLFGFVYPGESNKIPTEVLNSLLEQAKIDGSAGDAKPISNQRVCGGTILSREQYLTDVEDWGYADARLQPLGRMTKEDITHWTAAINR